MMDELHVFSRAELLLGKEKLDKLRNARVAVFGIGGVGSFAAEAIAPRGKPTTEQVFIPVPLSSLCTK